MKVTEVTTHIINSTWRNLVFVRVHTDAGIIGTGECTPVYGTGAMGTEAAAREIAAYHLVGRDPLDIEAFYDRAFRESFWGRNPGVLFMGGVSGLEQALWDIAGKAMDVPVWRLLGGKCRDQLRLYANGWYMEARTEGKLQAYVDAAKRVVDDGFTAMKFDPFMGSPTLNDAIPPKHIDTFRDGPIVERVAAVREAVGPDVDIIVEVHGWLDVRTAIRFGQKFAPYAPMAYEEPIEPTNVDAMKKVSDRV
ncbi:MAG TPA: mandelate racemase/muconate lactonizing enzyme family protein, partial [Chloroflexota bacterium]|nr:mandelate racemase/muconate lactonizing enzyme family protein [Chloroflexota bacterium]